MTEVGTASQVWRSKKLDYKNSVGWSAPDTQIKIVDKDSGQLLGPNQVGEILIKNLQTTPGYLNQSDRNSESFDSDGFFRSGDAGYYDEQELLYILDRYKQIIKVEGVSVLPSELEYLLLTHDHISEAAVIGVEDQRFGEIPKAFVVLKPNREISEESIVKYIDGLVNYFKRLRGGVTFLKELPKTSSGKINKSLLK